MSRVQLSTWGIAALVALRVGVGLHFFYEGADKLLHPKPFSAGFFGNAKGPLASVYKSMVWDADGEYRLDQESTKRYWEQYSQQVSRHYGFDDAQAKQADQLVKNYAGRLKNYIGARSGEYEEYFNQLARRDKNAKDQSRELKSLQAHDAKITGERMKLKGQLIPGIDAIWKDVERDMNGRATEKQWQAAGGGLPIGKIGRRIGDSEFADAVVPYFDLLIGFCLVVGLFVRPAAILGGLFLLSICLSQFPGSVGAAPIYNQAVEMLAMFTLAAVGAGNLAGLDFFITTWLTRKKPAPATTTGRASAAAAS